MPKIRGFFDNFAHSDEIPPEKVLKWLGPKATLPVVTNYLGNRFLYPQTVAQTQKELLIDLALLREVIALNPQSYFEPVTHRIFIPEEALTFFPNPIKLVMAFVDVLPLSGITTIWGKGAKLGSLGTVITPDKAPAGKTFQLNISSEQGEIKPQSLEFKTGSVIDIPVYCQKLTLHFSSKEVSLHSEHNLKTEIPCGLAGIIVDGRVK